jgi:hypothetical protein
MAVSDQVSNKVDHEVGNAAVSGVLDLGDVLELVIDGFDDSALAQQELVEQRQQAVLHVASDRCDQMKSLHDQLPCKLLGDVTFVAEKLAGQASDQAWDRPSVIDCVLNLPRRFIFYKFP